MKRLMIVAAVIAGMLLLSACAASRQAYYDANTKAAKANALAVKAKFDALATASAKCQTDGCAGMAMMGIAMTETPQAQAIRQYRAEGWQLVGLADTAIRMGANAYSEDSRNDLFGGIFKAFAANGGDHSIRIDQSNHSNNSINDSGNDSSDNSQTGPTNSFNEDNDTDDDIAIEVDGALINESQDVNVEQGPGDQQSPPTTIIDDSGDCRDTATCTPTEQPEG